MNQLFSRFTHHVSFTVWIFFRTYAVEHSKPTPAPLIRGVDADLSPLEVVANARFIGQLQSGLRLVVGLGLSERRRLIARTPLTPPPRSRNPLGQAGEKAMNALLQTQVRNS